MKKRNSTLITNTFINFTGQLIPIILAFLTLPIIIRGLGNDRYGLLTLSYAVLGYFTMFDLGVGRASIKYIAEAINSSSEYDVSRAVSSSITFQLILGVFFGILFNFLICDLLVDSLNLNEKLKSEASMMFNILSFSIPIVTTQAALSGVLEAKQRFDLVNAVKIPAIISTYFVFPLLGIYLELDLIDLILLIVSTRILSVICYFSLCLREIKTIKIFFFDVRYLSKFTIYGLWVTISNIASVLMENADRFIIGSFISITSVTYYVIPYEIVSKIRIFSNSITLSTFPIFSSLNILENRSMYIKILGQSIKFIIIFVGPTVLFVILFANLFLTLWLGSEFAKSSTLVLQVIAIGIFANSIANVPFSFFQSVGSPNIPAKYHITMLPFYLLFVILLAITNGIIGVAIAWTLRCVVDLFLLSSTFIKQFKPQKVLFVDTKSQLLIFLIFILAAGLLFYLQIYLSHIIQLLIFIMLLGAYYAYSWKKTLALSEKLKILTILGIG